MKKVLLSLLLILLPSALFCAMFPGYDFTFFETVSEDSLQINTDDTFGLDYTGYGFIGSDMTTGIYLRLGIQAPYSSILSVFDDEDEETIQENLERSFRFLTSLGPSFRRAIGDDAIWYMGLGAAYKLDYSDRQSVQTDTKYTYLDMSFGFDFDMGIRIDAAGSSTVRIGVHGAYTFFSVKLDILSPRNGEGERSTTGVMIPNMFLPKGVKQPFKAEGYISLGHTFRKDRKEVKKKYIITTPERFSGILLEMDQELPPS